VTSPHATHADALKPAYHSLKKLEGQIAAVQISMRDVQSALAGSAEHRRAPSGLPCRRSRILRARRCEQGLLAELDTRLDEPRIVGHVQQAIASAPFTPTRIPTSSSRKPVPQRFLQTVAEGDPARRVFRDHDPIKQNLATPIDFASGAVDTRPQFPRKVLARRAIRPAVIQRFYEPLQRHYDALLQRVVVPLQRLVEPLITAGRIARVAPAPLRGS
jgi:hypothetical protein